jgi:hypothetical protein
MIKSRLRTGFPIRRFMTNEKISSFAVCAVLISIWTGPVFLMSAKASEKGLGNSPADKAEGVSPRAETGRIVDASNPIGPGGVSMRVLWTVSGYVLGKAATMDEQEAKSLLFKPLDIKETEIIFNGRVCNGVTFQREMVDTAEYLAAVWQFTPQTLGIDEQKMQVIKTNCDIPGFQEYMRLSDRRLIVPIKGVFFFFEPAVAQ